MKKGRTRTPECYSLGFQYYPAQPGESFKEPDCPLQSLRAAAEAAAPNLGDAGAGWRRWAKYSHVLARPANTARADEFAKTTADAIKAPACRPDEMCPYNASANVYRRRLPH